MHLYQHREIHRPAGFHLENLASSQALQKSDKKSNFIQVSKALSPMNEQVSFSLPEMLDPRQFWNVGKNRYALSIYYCLVKATHGTSRTVKHQKFLNFWLDMLKLIDNQYLPKNSMKLFIEVSILSGLFLEIKIELITTMMTENRKPKCNVTEHM